MIENIYIYIFVFRKSFFLSFCYLMSSSTPKPITLEGSCHCQRVKFSVDSCLYIDHEKIFLLIEKL